MRIIDIYPFYQKLNYRCKAEEQHGTGPGSCVSNTEKTKNDNKKVNKRSKEIVQTSSNMSNIKDIASVKTLLTQELNNSVNAYKNPIVPEYKKKYYEEVVAIQSILDDIKDDDTIESVREKILDKVIDKYASSKNPLTPELGKQYEATANFLVDILKPTQDEIEKAVKILDKVPVGKYGR